MVTPGRHFPPFLFLIFAHIHAMVFIYIPTRRPFNMLSNGMFNLAIQAFIYEVQVEMYLLK